MLTTNSYFVMPTIPVEKKRIKDRRYIIKKIFTQLTDQNRSMDSHSIIYRTTLVRLLEKSLRTEFSNSKDFRQKVEKYLENYDFRLRPPNERIKLARKRMGWTQEKLAKHLGYSTHVAVHQVELGKRFPTTRVFRWLDEQKM